MGRAVLIASTPVATRIETAIGRSEVGPADRRTSIRRAGLPRFVPEDVMAQLESDTALGALEDPSTRHLMIMIIESGLRAGDACRPRLGCLVADGVGAPCLRSINTEVGAEQLIPLAARAAEAIRAQQDDHTLGTRTINRGVQ